MRGHRTAGMRSYWDERARENAAWYVDTSLSYDDPDLAQFWLQGERIVRIALEPAAAAAARRDLAVEIGSGLGRNCKALTTQFSRVIGLDVAPEMVRRARELVPAASFELVDGASMSPIGDDTADFVLSFTVFQHIPNPAVIEEYITEAGRVLRAGGVLSFQWNNEPGHRRWAIRRWWLGLLHRTRLRPERYQRHAPQFLGSRVPFRRIERAIARADMEIVESSHRGTLYAWVWARRR